MQIDELALQIHRRQHRYKVGIEDSEIPWLEAGHSVNSVYNYRRKL